MKKTFLILISFLVLHFCSYAQDSKSVIIKDSRTFTLEKKDTVNDYDTIKFDVEFEEKKYKIDTSSSKSETFTLDAPLKRDSIYSRFKDYTEYSVNEVFIWLYSFNYSSETEKSGTLNLNKTVKIKKYNSQNKADKILLIDDKEIGYTKFKENEKKIKQLTKKILESDTTDEALLQINEVQKKLKKLKDENSKFEKYFSDIKPINKISIQFEHGFIEKVQVWVESQPGKFDIYENIHAIGFTSVSNYRTLTLTKLFPRNRSLAGTYISLGDVISNYDNFLDLYTRDYSPADTAVNFIDPKDNPYLVLTKERTISLIDTKIYSDLNGFSESKPNGIIQLEASKKFNINTSRGQIFSTRTNYGYFNYMTIGGTVDKIEDKQKHLPLRNANITSNGNVLSPDYVSNLDLRRYQNLSIFVEPNIFLIDKPDNKFTIRANMYFAYGHTPILKTTETEGQLDSTFIDGHTYNWGPKIVGELFSDRRIGITGSWQFNTTRLFSNNQFIQVFSYQKADLTKTEIDRRARKSHIIEFVARYETNKDDNGALFFRSRFFIQHGDINTFFSQFQLGYSYNFILKPR